MRVYVRTFSLLAALLGSTGALAAQELREDSYRWYFGAQGGVLLTQTQTQDYASTPSVGFHLLVMGKRAGLMLSFDEALGSDETSAFGDATAPNGAREVTYDHLRKYTAGLMIFPLRARFEPFLGLGFGILHTTGTQVEGVFTDPVDAADALAEAKERGSTGFGSLLGGLQYRASKNFVIFGQYQITTAPSDGSLLVGPSHGLVAGLRFGLGKAKEDIKGGGY
ncbi:MAG TPA: hypothetical protein VJU15_11525 [Gemmatimonadales bacterium]|nr:hypothetical protein [Gemmatimonadales bacterium]